MPDIKISNTFTPMKNQLIQTLDFGAKLLLILVLISIITACKKRGSLNVRYEKLNNVGEIRPVNDSLVKPYDYLNAISLKDLPVKEKKQKFFDMILPAVLIAKYNLNQDVIRVNSISERPEKSRSSKEKSYLEKLMTKYKVESIDDLQVKLATHPTSIVLAQAAIESGWGTSRFFTDANNIFGVWSFNSNDDRIKASSHRSGKNIYLKKYRSLSGSIDNYFETIARGPYKEFRKMRLQIKDPYKLIPYLDKYSERGEAYVEEIGTVIRKNSLIKFDSYIIDPEFIN